MKNMIANLPDEIYIEIQNFLSKEDYRYFINITKKWYNGLRKRTIYYILTITKSLEYIRNLSFQELLLSKVDNGWKQIRLNLYKRFDGPTFLSIPAHYIHIESNHSFNVLESVHNQSIISTRTTFPEIPFLPHIKELTIYNTLPIRHLSNCSHLTSLSVGEIDENEDLSLLHNIENLTVRGCHMIKDYSILFGPKVKRLSLSNCFHLIKINHRHFHSLQYLSLYACPHLVDISSLHGIRELTLTFCPRVQDISNLGNHYRFELIDCSKKIIGYNSLSTVTHVKLSKCDIKCVKMLANARSVTLISCCRISSVLPLKSVRSVELIECESVRDIHELKDIFKLKILKKSLHHYKTIPLLQNKHLELRLPTRFITDFSFVHNIQDHFTLRQTASTPMTNDELISCFQHLQSLRVEDCDVLHHLNGLGDIPIIDLSFCRYLSDITGLGRNRSVKINRCDQIRRVSNLASVPIVTIICCRHIEDLESLNNVSRLTIR